MRISIPSGIKQKKKTCIFFDFFIWFQLNKYTYLLQNIEAKINNIALELSSFLAAQLNKEMQRIFSTNLTDLIKILFQGSTTYCWLL